jgi:hypothetical protein
MHLNLESVYYYSNQISSLSLISIKNLVQLDCRDNKLSSLNLVKNQKLELLWCHDNLIKTICVSDIEKAKKNTLDRKWTKDPTVEYKICN